MAPRLGRTVDEVIASLPPACQARIDTRYRALHAKVKNLAALRHHAGGARTDLPPLPRPAPAPRT